MCDLCGNPQCKGSGFSGLRSLLQKMEMQPGGHAGRSLLGDLLSSLLDRSVRSAMFSGLSGLLASPFGEGEKVTIAFGPDGRIQRRRMGVQTEKKLLKDVPGVSPEVLTACQEYGDLCIEVSSGDEQATRLRAEVDELISQVGRDQRALLLAIWRQLSGESHQYFGRDDLALKDDNGRVIIINGDEDTVCIPAEAAGKLLLERQQKIEQDEGKIRTHQENATRLEREVRALETVLESKRERVGELFEEQSEELFSGDDIMSVALGFTPEVGTEVLIQRFINEEGGELSVMEKAALLEFGRRIEAKGETNRLPPALRELMGLNPPQATPKLGPGGVDPTKEE